MTEKNAGAWMSTPTLTDDDADPVAVARRWGIEVREPYLAQRLIDPEVAKRFRSYVSSASLSTGCHIWTGAISGRGHGRFWVGSYPDGRDCVVVAHRFGYALAHGLEALKASPVIRHVCDEPSCQTPAHWVPGTVQENTSEWSRRRWIVGSPLRDTRRGRGRAQALRAAALAGLDLDATARAGMPTGDQWQEPLLGL